MKIEFVSRDRQHSEYDWADITLGSERIGKARCKIDGDTIVVCSLNIYPEFAGRGYGQRFVEDCKERFQVVIADRVRPSAVGFWETVGFHADQEGNWVFRRP